MVVFSFRALAMMAMVVPSIVLAAPASPPEKEESTFSWKDHARPVKDCLLDASVSPHDDQTIATEDSIQDPVKKTDVEKVTKSAVFLEKEMKKEWDMAKVAQLPPNGLLLRPTKVKTENKLNTRRTYENPLPDEGTWNEKAHAMIDQETLEVDEKKTATNEPRYVRKEQVEQRPTLHCEQKTHE
ncbi:hypothetical protein FHETE_9408 [Fusarium heterosporum]|uniref:Uncharacterized protein n=1 Tax=Fusarium heterosporum TaxID=42747 RepID=A0A8H5SUZ0_FUSHE|nr:hypothetical protein FHETE_9408 [Fusarium heterosporum]